MHENPQTAVTRFLLFGLWFLLTVAVFWKPCLTLLQYSLTNANASHVLLIPCISLWLLYLEQKNIFQTTLSIDYRAALIPFTIAVFISSWAWRNPGYGVPINRVATYIVAVVCFWIAGFTLLFGRAATGRGRFALLFLFLTVPLPDSLLNYVVYALQKGSADIAEMIFDLAGVPALRDGFIFRLAHVSIEVAKECSGIRSSVALLILALLVGHLFLRTLWKQALLVIVGLVIMIVKNGVRIATLTILAQYVNPSFLTGRLHHEGGVVFFLVGLLLLFPIFWLLQRSEISPEPVVRAKPA